MLSRLLDRNGVRIQKGMTPAERKKEEQLRNAVSVAGGKMASQMRTANAVPGRADALAKEQQDAEARSEKFLREVFLAHPELRTQRGELADVDLVALQKVVFAREPDLAILSYLATFDRVLIAVVTAGDKPDGPARVVIRSSPVEEKEMTDAAVGFRDACQASKAGRPVSDDLYRWLIEPAERDIAGKKHGNGLKGGTVLL